MDLKSIRWGIIGPGAIATTMADAMRHSPRAQLVSVTTRNLQSFGNRDKFPGARIVEGYQTLLDDPEIEAVYIATPHPRHAEWVIKSLDAGKHVLCEKPLAVSRAEAEAMLDAAAASGRFLGEAFMYRLHPQTAMIVDLVRSGAIGEVRLIRASFGFRAAGLAPDNRLVVESEGGGGILDIGCYPVSMARLLAGAAEGKPFVDPSRVTGVGRMTANGIDEMASALLQFPSGIIAELSASISVAQDNVVRVFGTGGWMEIQSPWDCTGRHGGRSDIVIRVPGEECRTITVDEPGWLYSFQLDAVAEAIQSGRTQFEAPGPDWQDTLGNIRTLDAWRASIGLEYSFERARPGRTKIDGRPLAGAGRRIPQKAIPGLSRAASIIALGGGGFDTYAQAAIVLDAYYEAGGNLLDTAWIYSEGRCDRYFGDWMQSRGVRDDMIVLGKGAHPPLVYPDVIAQQLDESLDRLKTDRMEIYLMHRDNVSIPIGEFVDAMDAEVKAGRISIYGGSNWTRERMDAARDYAIRHGRQPPHALSNNFSLAQMVEPVWPGVMSSSDEAWKDWLARGGVSLFAWSSQGRGFFTERAGPDKRGDPEMVRSWYSATNFARRERAIALARQLGVNPVNVALAYCLAQVLPIFPIIGPLRISELQDSLNALDVKLAPADLRWLESGELAARSDVGRAPGL